MRAGWMWVIAPSRHYSTAVFTPSCWARNGYMRSRGAESETARPICRCEEFWYLARSEERCGQDVHERRATTPGTKRTASGRTAEEQRRDPTHGDGHQDRRQAVVEALIVGEIIEPPLQSRLVDEQRRGLGADHGGAAEQEDFHIILAARHSG